MDLNELRGRVLRVNLARPQKLTAATSGNKAGMSLRLCYSNTFPLPHFIHSLTDHLLFLFHILRIVWESEEWLKQYAKPLAESGGVGARAVTRSRNASSPDPEKIEEEGDDAMEE